MTPESVPAPGDPRRLLSDARDLARRVRVSQRVTWFPLLVLAILTLAAIPVMRYTAHTIDCIDIPDGRVCKVTHPGATAYWPIAVVVGYTAIAVCYWRVARSRGVGTRVLPYVLTGVGLTALFLIADTIIVQHLPEYPDTVPGYMNSLFRLTDMPAATGLALLVLAWLERHLALLLFTLAYLAVVLVPINFGLHQGMWGLEWGGAPQLLVQGGVLLLGAVGFAVARRWQR